MNRASRALNWSRRQLCRVGKAFPSVYGPRGMVLLGFAMLAAILGLSYVGPAASTMTSPATAFVSSIMPLSLWGVVWFVASFSLLVAAFKRDQSKALGGVVGLLFLWFVSYLVGCITELAKFGQSRLWLGCAIFAAFVILGMGVARMLNHTPRDGGGDG